MVLWLAFADPLMARQRDLLELDELARASDAAAFAAVVRRCVRSSSSPPVVEQLNSLPNGSAIAEILSDFAVLRAQARTCVFLSIPR